jgi:hypothetical protein
MGFRGREEKERRRGCDLFGGEDPDKYVIGVVWFLISRITLL